ncbi:Hsp20/alpha crystallin family protein [Niallia sp. 03133]|uniref:Hsp20/alpha crystallin family protein n=1 Tax=Niallia sp. 03133 TaxID=3458060 RepID=UPI004044DBAC
MSTNFPNDPNKKDKSEPFGGMIKSMNAFFQEKPVKNFLQSMDDFFSNPFPNMAFPLSVKETDAENIITAELPGINKEQISIDVYDHHITISINYLDQITEENKKQNLFRSTQTYKRNSRTVSFPYPIDESKVKASYQNGLLTISIPKQKGKKISIDATN